MKNNSKVYRIAMLGASFNICGGITSVEKLITNNAGRQLSIIHLPTFDSGRLAQNALVYWSSIFRLIYLVIFRKIDFVHIHFSERGSTIRKLLPSLISIIFKYPLILHAHGSTYKEFFTPLPNFIKKIIISIFSRCSVFISLSKSWDNYYKEAFFLKDNQSIIMYNPVKIPEYIQEKVENQFVTFVFLGRIGSRNGPLEKANMLWTFHRQDKGAFDIIKAFSLLPIEYQQKAKIVIAGDGAVDTARNLIKQYKVNQHITVHPWVNEVTRDELLRNSDVFLLPSYNEGLPMSMLEAMACALPVIVTPVGGIPEFVTNNTEGIIVTPGNVEEISNAMKTLISDSILRKTMGINSRKRIEVLSITKYMIHLTQLYRNAKSKTIFQKEIINELNSKSL